MKRVDLKVVYRYYAGENMKGRPSYYSKDLALASLLRALDPAVAAEVIFMVDGEVSPRVRGVMEKYGSIVFIKGGNSPRAFCGAIPLPRTRGWADDAVVLFCEDDYLWRPDCLTQVVEGAKALPDTAYFAPYALREDFPTPPTGPGPSWLPITSTTMTFAGRVAALKQDERFMRLCVKSGAHFDTALFYALAGKPYFTWGQLARDTIEKDSLKGRAKRVARSGVRVAVNLGTRRRPARQRKIAGAWTNTATHLEADYLAEGYDWTALAAETLTWIDEHELPLVENRAVGT